MLFALTGIGLSAWLCKISNTCDTIMWVPEKVNPLNFVIKSWKSLGTQSPWIKVNEVNLSKLCSRIQNFWKKLGYNWSKNSEKKLQVVKSISSCQKPWEFSPVLQPVAKELRYFHRAENWISYSNALMWNNSHRPFGILPTLITGKGAGIVRSPINILALKSHSVSKIFATSCNSFDLVPKAFLTTSLFSVVNLN